MPEFHKVPSNVLKGTPQGEALMKRSEAIGNTKNSRLTPPEIEAHALRFYALRHVCFAKLGRLARIYKEELSTQISKVFPHIISYLETNDSHSTSCCLVPVLQGPSHRLQPG